MDHDKSIFAQPRRPGGVAEGIRTLLVAFPDSSVAMERLVGEEDYVVAQVRNAGTNTGPYSRVPAPTGRHTEWESVIVFRMENGKKAELWSTSDRMGMLTRLGLFPEISSAALHPITSFIEVPRRGVLRTSSTGGSKTFG